MYYLWGAGGGEGVFGVWAGDADTRGQNHFVLGIDVFQRVHFRLGAERRLRVVDFVHFVVGFDYFVKHSFIRGVSIRVAGIDAHLATKM